MSGEYTMDLRISHYLECKNYPDMVGAIVCFYQDGLIHVRPGLMPWEERRNEWRFGTDLSRENVICTVRYSDGHVYFQCFRPDLRQPCKEKSQ